MRRIIVTAVGRATGVGITTARQSTTDSILPFFLPYKWNATLNLPLPRWERNLRPGVPITRCTNQKRIWRCRFFAHHENGATPSASLLPRRWATALALSPYKIRCAATVL